MSGPVRIQLRRTKGWNLQQVSLALNGLPAVKVDRSTRWGNDFTVEDFGSAAAAVNMFEHDLAKFSVFHPDDYRAWIGSLRNKNLACWCKIPTKGERDLCHATVLIELANIVCETV